MKKIGREKETNSRKSKIAAPCSSWHWCTVLETLWCIFFSLQSYIKTSSSGEKSEWSLTVAGRNISYSIVDVGGKQARTLF